MSLRQSVLALIIAAAAAPAAFANSGATWVGGEAGFQLHPTHSQTTREQVRAEFEAFRRNPVTADGYDVVGGELGYAPHQHKYITRDGAKVHADGYAAVMGNAAAPAPTYRAQPRLPGQEYFDGWVN